MSIRIRTVRNKRIAICAASSGPMEGDLYLDDGDHHALTRKFQADFMRMGFWYEEYLDQLKEKEEQIKALRREIETHKEIIEILSAAILRHEHSSFSIMMKEESDKVTELLKSTTS